MTVSMLINFIDEHCHYYYSGPLHEEIYGVQIAEKEETLIPNILYVTTGWRNVVMTQNICLLIVPEKDISEIVQSLRQNVMKDYQRNINLDNMGTLVTEHTEIGDLCSAAFKIMGNPVCFLNPNFQVCCSEGANSIEADTMKIRQNLKSKSISSGRKILLLEPETAFPYRRMLAPIFHAEGLIGYLYIAELFCSFVSKSDEYYAEKICKLLSTRESMRSRDGIISEKQRFVEELIEGSITDKDLLEQKMKHFGLYVRPSYYVFSVQLEDSFQTKTVVEKLSSLLENPVYEYRGYGVALIGEDDLDIEREEIKSELIEFLKQMNLYAGISNNFSDLQLMPNAYRESIYAVSFRKRLTDKVYLSFYREIAGIHMYHQMEEAGIDVSFFCDPVALKIERYDREHGTKYLNSLVVYICLNCSLQQAADVLFIHKSTLLKHIRVLEERFHINFDNHRVINSLRRTLEIFSYLGKIDVQKLLGNEQ